MLNPALRLSVIFLGFAPYLAFSQTADLKQKAESGNVQAQTELGLALRDSNPEAAAEWFRKAAEQGDPRAQNSLGVLYHIGLGVPKDFGQAFEWYKKSAAQKYGPGVFNVAISYYNGEGVPEDPVTAYGWMLLAQELGQKEADDAVARTGQELKGQAAEGELKLGDLFYAGKELPKDEVEAGNWYRLAADHGSAQAQVKYGLMLAEGRGGVSKDPEQAFRLMRRAADQKYSPAMFSVGYAYHKGTLGQQVDIKKAITWYEGAAAAGHPGAMVNLGLMNADGSLGQPNYREAYFWLHMADAFNMPQAKSSIPSVTAHLSQKEIVGIEQSAGIWWQQKGTAALLVRRPPEPLAAPEVSNNLENNSGNSNEKIYAVGGDVHAPRLLSSSEPRMSPDHRSGTVILMCTVETDGTVRNIEVVQSLSKEQDQEAIDALKKWKFSPATKNGEPVAVKITTQFKFSIQHGALLP